MQSMYELMNTVLRADTVVICVRIILAILCGGIIGLERGKANQPAGMRTYMLVCLGSTLVMLTAEHMYNSYGTGDPSRLGAQIINGIGFLGAGSIIISRRRRIKGLTTAAGLWVSACIGIALGIGFYLGGTLSTLAVYMIMSKFRRFEGKFEKSSKWYKFHIEFEGLEVVSKFKKKVEKLGFEVTDLEIKYNESKDYCDAVVEVKTSQGEELSKIIEHLEEIEGVDEIRQINK
jgi:Uncharacterized membrane protein